MFKNYLVVLKCQVLCDEFFIFLLRLQSADWLGCVSRSGKKKGRRGVSRKSSQNDESMEGSVPAVPAEPGTLKVIPVPFLPFFLDNNLFDFYYFNTTVNYARTFKK